IFRRQMSITEPNSPVAVQRDAPHGAILWPTLRISKKALHEALCDPPVMRQKGKVDVNERIGCVEPVPRRSDTVIAINDPPILLEEVRVNFQILLVRDLAAILLFRSIAACSELDCIQRIERQPSYGRQTLRKRRFPSARISKDGDLFHGACSRSPQQDTIIPVCFQLVLRSEMGSNATEMRCPRYVRISPDSDRNADIAGCLKRPIADIYYVLAANKSHRPGRPLSSCDPR